MERRDRDPLRDRDRDPPGPPRRFPRLVVPQATRRVAPTRLGLAAFLAVGLLGLFVLGGPSAWEAGRRWLHGQAGYQRPFAEITLDPAPPPWIRGGAKGLLEQVRKSAQRPETLAILDFDLDALAVDFQLNPWVVKVLRVERRHPNGLSVRLEYRRPVARVGTAGPVVDGEAVVLPEDDFDLEGAGPLVILHGIAPGTEGGPEPVVPVSRARGGLTLRDPLARPAASLAGFVQSRRAQAPPSGRVEAIYSTARGLYLVVPDGTYFFWVEAPGEEPPGKPSAAVKWAMLTEWAGRRDRKALQHPDYYAFHPKGLVAVSPRVGSARQGTIR